MGIESFRKSDGQRIREGGGMKEAPMYRSCGREGRAGAPGSDE